MSEAMMNGPSALNQGERELVLAYASAAAGCKFVQVAHSEVAYAWGIERGLVERFLEDPESCANDRLKAMLIFVGKLARTPNDVVRADVEAVLAAGWSERALDDAIGVTARAAFMHRLTAGYGFVPMSREAAAKKAPKRIEHGYVNLYPEFQKQRPSHD